MRDRLPDAYAQRLLGHVQDAGTNLEVPADIARKEEAKRRDAAENKRKWKAAEAAANAKQYRNESINPRDVAIHTPRLDKFFNDFPTFVLARLDSGRQPRALGGRHRRLPRAAHVRACGRR